jgi:hypothetical protein
MYRWFRATLVLWALFAIPFTSAAQGLGTIAGAVRDTSGAVLPGVTVEVRSEALIEQVRSVVSDASGQYSIVNLPPGTYSVAFTLPGFNALRREGIRVLANFTATANAELAVGGLEETVTVTGEAPLVDTRRATTVRAVTPEVIRAVPNGGTMYQLAQMYVGVTYTGPQDVGGASGSPVQSQLVAHGGRAGDEQQLVDGIRVGNMASAAGRTQQTLSPLLYEQVDLQLSGQGAEVGTTGVISNAIPRSGGNTFSTIGYVNGSAQSLQSSNLTERLEGRGLSAGDSKLGIKKLYDLNGSLSGPIRRDRLWFFGAGRYQTNENYIAGAFNPVDPRAWVRVEDRTRQATDPQYLWDTVLRLTLLASSKMRVAYFQDVQHKWWDYWALSASVSPEATGRVDWPGRIYQGTWNYTPTSRLLFEAGFNHQDSTAPIKPRPGEDYGRRIVEQGGVVVNGVPVAPITYGAYGGEAGYVNDKSHTIQAGRASMSYVTGSHNFKVGMDLQRGQITKLGENFISDIRYRTRGFVLNQVSLFSPFGLYKYQLDYNLGTYVQDQWTTGRMTVSGGMRFEFLKQSYDPYTAGPTRYLPNRNFSFPGATVVGWRDANPRLGLSYDVFGDGRTAVKFSAGRGVEQEGLNTAQTLVPAVAVSTNTAINVDDLNGNNVADCDLLNPLPNGECQGWLNANFGRPIAQTQRSEDTRFGWGVRPWNWEFTAGVQHQVQPRLSVGLTFFRRIYGNFLVTDSPETTPADYRAFGVTVPTDPNLPTSGSTLTIYDINQRLVGGGAFNTVTNRTMAASDFGKQREHWNGFDFTSNARLGGGAVIEGGVTFGKGMTDNCEVIEKVPEALGNLPKEFCHQETGWEPNYKMLASYTLPYGVRISGNFLSLPGPRVAADVIYPGAQLVPSLGRPLTGGGNRTVSAISPGTVYGDRRTQFDLRFSKIFNIGSSRSIDANVDLYNAFNSDAVISELATYGATWRRPTAVLQGRIIKFGLWLRF